MCPWQALGLPVDGGALTPQLLAHLILQVGADTRKATAVIASVTAATAAATAKVNRVRSISGQRQDSRARTPAPGQPTPGQPGHGAARRT